ncbi:nucleoside hydrolase, partial [Escherichia coli]
MEKRKIILDCDPGHDDAIAIMMAAKHPAIDLLGITIVAGNQTLDKTLINGLNVCQKLEINVPVYAGMPQPIMRQQIVADNIHGETGLGNDSNLLIVFYVQIMPDDLVMQLHR